MADVVFAFEVTGVEEGAAKTETLAAAMDHAGDSAEKTAIQLKSIDDLKLDADIAGLEDKLYRLRAELDVATGTRHVKIEADIAQAERELAHLRAQGDDTARSLEDSGRMGSSGMVAIGVGAIASAGWVLGLGAAAVTAGGVAVAAWHGVTAAVDLLNQRTGQATDQQRQLGVQIAAAFAQMSTGGQDFALELSKLEQGPLKQLQISAQSGLLQGLSDGFKESERSILSAVPAVDQFSTDLGGMLRQMIPGVADLGGAFVRFSDTSLNGLHKFPEVMDGIETHIKNMMTDLEDSGDAQKSMESLVEVFDALNQIVIPVLEHTAHFTAELEPMASAADKVATALGNVMNFLDRITHADLGVLGKIFSFLSPGALSTDMFGVPLLAEGGTAITGGWSVVGDKGPELRYQPPGATIVPLTPSALSMIPQQQQAGNTYVTNHNTTVNGVVGPPAQVTAAIRTAMRTTVNRGHGFSFT